MTVWARYEAPSPFRAAGAPRGGPRLARAAALALLACASLLASGCSDIETIDAQVELGGHRMVVMPMKDRLQFHFDSQRGIGLARLVTERIQAARKDVGDDAMDVVPFEELEAEIGKVHKDPKDLKPADIGRMMKADLVLVGNIESFESRIPGDIGFSRGRAAVSVKVLEVAKPERPFFSQRIEVKYPEENLTGSGVDQSAEASTETVERGLMALLAKKIGEMFYAHEEKKARH